jgi:hypothetical protein
MWQFDYEKGYLIKIEEIHNSNNYPLSMYDEHYIKYTFYCLYTGEFLKYEYSDIPSFKI